MKKISYQAFTERNVGGFISATEQERLRETTIAVLGMGGIGGVAAEILVRTGIGSLRIVDHDIFEISNLNRQIFSFCHTLGRSKTEVATEFLKEINPELGVEIYDTVDKKNASAIITGCEVVIMGIDSIVPCIEASRIARKINVSLIEGWALPYGNVRVIDSQTPSLETLYALPTIGHDISEFSQQELGMLDLAILGQLMQIEGITEFAPPESLALMASGQMPPRSFAPMAWLAAVMMATEAIKVILGRGQIARAPEWAFYDPYSHRIPKNKTLSCLESNESENPLNSRSKSAS